MSADPHFTRSRVTAQGWPIIGTGRIVALPITTCTLHLVKNVDYKVTSFAHFFAFVNVMLLKGTGLGQSFLFTPAIFCVLPA